MLKIAAKVKKKHIDETRIGGYNSFCKHAPCLSFFVYSNEKNDDDNKKHVRILERMGFVELYQDVLSKKRLKLMLQMITYDSLKIEVERLHFRK